MAVTVYVVRPTRWKTSEALSFYDEAIRIIAARLQLSLASVPVTRGHVHITYTFPDRTAAEAFSDHIRDHLVSGEVTFVVRVKDQSFLVYGEDDLPDRLPILQWLIERDVKFDYARVYLHDKVDSEGHLFIGMSDRMVATMLKLRWQI